MASCPDTFVHLHLHSEYSLLDGANRIDRLIERIKDQGMDAVALTDHGNLFGAIDFYTKAKEAGIKPILGIEAYVAPEINGKPGDRRDRTYTGMADGGFHLVLLAENARGWQNLLKLSSDSYLNGFYYRPRMDKSTLSQWSNGLIAINGHMGSSLAHLLTRYEQSKDENDFRRAVEEARWHAETFGPNEQGEPRFYIELQRLDVPEQLAINPHLQRLAEELSLPLVADNDAHFLLEKDHDAHDTLCCISMGKTKQDDNRFRYPSDVYVKSPQQMRQLFADVPEAVENTVEIARRCHVELDFSQNHAPVVKIEKKGTEAPASADRPRHKGTEGQDTAIAGDPQQAVGSAQWYKDFCADFELQPYDSQKDHDSPEELKRKCDQALRELAEAGAVWRYGPDGMTDEIRTRLDHELSILADKNISAYFLIVWDFVTEARRRGIPCNARGSGVGTMVGYCLGLSNACPVRYDLLFERFTDPDRSEYPDIDMDICQDGRQELIDYVRQKYGHVAQIITFGTLKARAAIRDVGRVLDVPLSDVDKICKLVGDGLGTTIRKALDQEPDLRKLYEDNPLHRTMLDTAQKLEGLSRHAGVHAAGVVIATQPLENIIPLYQPPGTDQIVTQWDGPTVDKIGLLKMDFLGLRTLSIIERAKKLIRQTLDETTILATVTPAAGEGTDGSSPPIDPLDLDRLSFDNQNVFDLFRRGETAGVFQFESGGFRNLLIGMKPDRIEDLIAANALYRPGPMELIPEYNDRKHDRLPLPKQHPIVKQYTGVTYGVLTYQEQVMQLLHELGGVPLNKAYKIIKAISKKQKEPFEKIRPAFIEGAQTKGMSEAEAQELFERMCKFSGYGFNKSHSTGYSIVAYQTAYLKTYFPVQYMAALLTYESVSTGKVVEYIDECRRVMFPDGHRGIEVRPPDVNVSEVGFTVVCDEPDKSKRDANQGYIRFGLSAVKGVGEKAIEAIIEAREKDPTKSRFESLYDFCERVPLTTVNRATTEALIKCGAFDSVHGAEKRAAMVGTLDAAIQAGQTVAADRNSGQMSFFDSFSGTDGSAGGETQKPASQLPDVPAWTNADQLKHEKSVLGFFVSSHPLDDHRDTLERYTSTTVANIQQLAADVPVVLGGLLTRIRTTFVRNGRSAGQKMAMVTIEDHTGQIDGVVFSDTYAIAAPLLVEDQIVLLKGKVDRRREEPNVVINEVIPLERAVERLTEAAKIVLEAGPEGTGGNGTHLINGELEKLKNLLHQSSGTHGNGGVEVYIEVHQDDCVVVLRLNGVRVGADADLPHRIDTILNAKGSCRLVGPPKVAPRHGPVSLTDDDAAAGASGRDVSGVGSG